MGQDDIHRSLHFMFLAVDAARHACTRHGRCTDVEDITLAFLGTATALLICKGQTKVDAVRFLSQGNLGRGGSSRFTLPLLSRLVIDIRAS